MNYIPTNTPIRLEWTVKKGIGNVVEDFSRSEVFLFLETDRDRWAVQCAKTSLGLISAELPNNMAEGVYHAELIWYKGEDALRSIQRTKKECVFAIDKNVEHKGNKCVVRIESIASTYGYDGLNGYDLAVMRGEVEPGSISEKEWADLAGQMTKYVGPFLTRKGGFANLPDPEKQIIPIGFTYLLQTDPNDMSTQRPVWWNGAAWIDSITSEALKREEADKVLNAKIEEEALVRETRDKRLDSYIKQNEEAILAEGKTREAEDEKLQKDIDDNYVILDNKKVEAKEINRYVNSIEDNIILQVKALQQRVENIKPVVVEGGTVVNNADEEDITNVNNALRLKDRDTLHGMGYVILRRDKAYNLQFAYANTIYEVRYDLDLQGGTLEIPDDCVLKFEGGKIKNGNVVLNNTLVLPNGCILSDHIKANVQGTHAKGQYLFDEVLGLPKYYDGNKWIDATGGAVGLMKVGSAAERPDARYQQIPIGFIYLEEKYKWANGEKVPTGDYAPWWFTGSTWVDAEGKEKPLPTGGEWYERPTENVPDGYQYMLRTAAPDGGTRTYPIWWSSGEVNWVDAQGSIINF